MSPGSAPHDLLASHDPSYDIAKIKGALKVFVVPIEYKPPYCPDAGKLCPKSDVLKLLGPPRHSADEWQVILNKDVNAYYSRATYGQTTFEFVVLKKPWITWSSVTILGITIKVPSFDLWELLYGKGWWASPHSFQDWCNSDSKGDCKGGGPDPRIYALQIAEKFVGIDELKKYDPPRMAALDNIHNRGAQIIWPTYKGKIFAAVGVREDVDDKLAVAILSHELGHSVGLPDLYDSPGMGDWDIMAWDPPYNHFSAWAKRHVVWMPDDAVVTILPPESKKEVTKVDLGALAIPPTTTNPKRVVRIPFTSLDLDRFLGYHVECRLRINGDENLPQEGILIISVDEDPPKGKAIANWIQLLKPGDEFSKAGIVIRYVALLGNVCQVEVERKDTALAYIALKNVWIDRMVLVSTQSANL